MTHQGFETFREKKREKTDRQTIEWRDKKRETKRWIVEEKD